MKNRFPIYGLMAEFNDPEHLLTGVHAARQAGYHRLDAYSPFPVEGLAVALGIRRTWLPLIVLLGGITGALGGFFLQYYASVIAYPLNVGGKPLLSWPAFIPVTFELTILVAAFAAVLGMLGLNGLPMPYHPVFNVEHFKLASRDRFFICIESIDPKFDVNLTKEFLQSLHPLSISEVDH